MSIRWILSLMIAISLLIAVLFYVTLKKAPGFKSQVTSQIQTEFLDYVAQTKHLDQIPVAEANNQKYLVPVNGPWKFEIRDKTLYVVAPNPESEGTHQPLPADLAPIAKKSVEELVLNWADQRFHSRNDFQLEVHFLNELQAQ